MKIKAIKIKKNSRCSIKQITQPLPADYPAWNARHRKEGRERGERGNEKMLLEREGREISFHSNNAPRREREREGEREDHYNVEMPNFSLQLPEPDGMAAAAVIKAKKPICHL